MKKKIKVIQIIDQPSGGGAEKICRNISRLLIEREINTNIIYFKNPKNINLEKFEKVYSGKLGYFGFIFFIRKIIKEETNKKYTKVIVQSHLTKSLYFTPLTTLKFKCKKIFVEHNTNYRRRRFVFLKYIERYIYTKYDKIICVSNATLSSLKNWLKKDNIIERMLVVYNGLNLQLIKKEKSRYSDKYRFVSIGSLTHQKGFDISIQALARLKFKNWHYKILGEGPEKSKLKELVNKLNLSDKITFTGYQDKIDNYMIESDIMIIPSRWEGFGLVAIEGLSYGMPIVVSDVPGINEIVQNSEVCILYKPEDLSHLALSIENSIKLLLDTDLNIEKEALKQATKFDEKTMINNYIKIYNDL